MRTGQIIVAAVEVGDQHAFEVFSRHRLDHLLFERLGLSWCVLF